MLEARRLKLQVWKWPLRNLVSEQPVTGDQRDIKDSSHIVNDAIRQALLAETFRSSNAKADDIRVSRLDGERASMLLIL